MSSPQHRPASRVANLKALPYIYLVLNSKKGYTKSGHGVAWVNTLNMQKPVYLSFLSSNWLEMGFVPCPTSYYAPPPQHMRSDCCCHVTTGAERAITKSGVHAGEAASPPLRARCTIRTPTPSTPLLEVATTWGSPKVGGGVSCPQDRVGTPQGASLSAPWLPAPTCALGL